MAMTQIDRVIRGLEILKTHGASEIYAEHDIICVAGPKDICKQSLEELEDLNWHWDIDVDSWAKFV